MTELETPRAALGRPAMSMATRTQTQSPALHGAERHEPIRVHGAREKNLKDVSVEIDNPPAYVLLAKPLITA
jgi:hypothetical protein